MKVHNLLSRLLKKDSLLWHTLESIYSISYPISYWLDYRSRPVTTREIYIEFVSYCNLRCPLCSLDHDKAKFRISPETLNRIFDQLYFDRRFRKVRIIHLHNAGEVLLHPEFQKLVTLIGEQKKRFQEAGFRFPKMAILTNATILKPALSDFILESGVFDYVRFSMDGGTPELFEQMRERAKWSVFYEQVHYFLKKKREGKFHSHVSFITMIELHRKQSVKWMHAEFQHLLKLADSYEIRYPHNWGGDVELNDGRTFTKKFKLGCTMLLNQLVFLPNGDVSICCNDLNSKGKIGNIGEQSLFEIYNSRKRLFAIEMLFRNRKHVVELCKDCQTY